MSTLITVHTKNAAIAVTAVGEAADTIAHSVSSSSVNAGLGENVVGVLGLRSTRSTIVVQQEAVPVPLPEDEGLAVAELHAGIAAVLGGIGTISNRLEVGRDTGSVVGNVDSVVSDAGVVEVGSEEVLRIASGEDGGAGNDGSRGAGLSLGRRGEGSSEGSNAGRRSRSHSRGNILWNNSGGGLDGASRSGLPCPVGNGLGDRTQCLVDGLSLGELGLGACNKELVDRLSRPSAGEYLQSTLVG
jgi:hypothetical protein